MAEMILDEDSKVLTKEKVESIRFIQNTCNGQLMIKDLGKKGMTLAPDEIVDLKKFFSKKEIGQSQQLDWCLKERHVTILEWEQLKDDNGDPTGIKLIGVKDAKNKYKPKGADLPKNVPVEDKSENEFDEGLDEIEDKEEAEDEDTKIGRKRRTKNKRKKEEDEDDD